MNPAAPEFQSEVDRLVEQGILAVKAGDRLRARQLLSQAVKQDPRHEQAWLWLASAHDDVEFRRICLEKVLALNPNNLQAKQGLQTVRLEPPRETVFSPPRKGTGELKPRTGPLPHVPAVVLKERRCPWCNAVVPERRALDRCTRCGHHLEFTCPACERDVAHDQIQCPYCRHTFGDFARDREGYLARLAEAYRAKGWTDRVEPLYTYLIEIAPRQAEYRLRLAQWHDQMGETGRCIQEYHSVLELDPHNVEALAQLSHWYLTLKQTHELKTLAERLHKIRPRSLRLTLLLSDLEYAREQYKTALRLYLEIVDHRELDPTVRARIRFRLGDLYEMAGEPRRAYGYYQASAATGLEIEETREARRRVEQLRPPLPDYVLRSHGELGRAMLGPVLLIWLTAAIHIGYQPRYLTPLGLVGLMLSIVGSYLLASALVTPLTREWRELLGEAGLTPPAWGRPVASLGGVVLLLSLTLVLLGM